MVRKFNEWAEVDMLAYMALEGSANVVLSPKGRTSHTTRVRRGQVISFFDQGFLNKNITVKNWSVFALG